MLKLLLNDDCVLHKSLVKFLLCDALVTVFTSIEPIRQWNSVQKIIQQEYEVIIFIYQATMTNSNRFSAP